MGCHCLLQKSDSVIHIYTFFSFRNFFSFFFTALGLHCTCAGFLSLVVASRFLLVVASLVVEHGV